MSSLINNGSVCSSLSEKESILTTFFCSNMIGVKLVYIANSESTNWIICIQKNMGYIEGKTFVFMCP